MKCVIKCITKKEVSSPPIHLITPVSLESCVGSL